MGIRCWVDGGAKPNPGRCYGSFKVFENGKLIEHKTLKFVTGTNNQAEYWSLIALLEYLAWNKIKDVTIHMDSKLVINQVSLAWKTLNQKLLVLVDEVLELLELFEHIDFIHISGVDMKEVLGH